MSLYCRSRCPANPRQSPVPQGLSLRARHRQHTIWVTTRPIARAIPRQLGVGLRGRWSPWVSPLGGSVASGPAHQRAATTAPSSTCSLRESSGTLVHMWYDGSKWSSWEDLGGAIGSAPASISTTVNNVDVFARGTDNGLYHRAWAGAWKAWEKIPGGVLTSGPSVASLAPGNMNVFVNGASNHMYYTWNDGGTWNAWQDLGCCIVGAPAAVSAVKGQLFTIGRGTDNTLYQQSWAGSWSGWNAKLGAQLDSPPAVINYAYNSTGARRTAVYAMYGGSPYEMINDSNSWSAWTAVSTLPGYQIVGVGNCIDVAADNRSLVLGACDFNSMRQRFISQVIRMMSIQKQRHRITSGPMRRRAGSNARWIRRARRARRALRFDQRHAS